MTKKDFELIAQALRSSQLWWISGHLGYTASCEIADALKASNPRFDRSRFLQACTPAGMDASYCNLSQDEPLSMSMDMCLADVRTRNEEGVNGG